MHILNACIVTCTVVVVVVVVRICDCSPHTECMHCNLHCGGGGGGNCTYM